MNNEIFGKIDEIQNACRNANGGRIAIPLLKKIQIIDGEMYAYVEDFLNAFGDEVDNDTKLLIENKIRMVN